MTIWKIFLWPIFIDFSIYIYAICVYYKIYLSTPCDTELTLFNKDNYIQNSHVSIKYNLKETS